jgi:hypothetical protein
MRFSYFCLAYMLPIPDHHDLLVQVRGASLADPNDAQERQAPQDMLRIMITRVSNAWQHWVPDVGKHVGSR